MPPPPGGPPGNWNAHLCSWEMGSSTSRSAHCLATLRMIYSKKVGGSVAASCLGAHRLPFSLSSVARQDTGIFPPRQRSTSTQPHKALSIPSEDRCHHALGSHSPALHLWVTPSVWIWGDPSSCALPSHTIGGSVMPVTVQISCTREP